MMYRISVYNQGDLREIATFSTNFWLAQEQEASLSARAIHSL